MVSNSSHEAIADDPAEFGLDVLEAAIDHTFADRGLLERAVTHSSLGGDARHAGSPDYERLEFLGDRVLGLIMAEWLLERYPTESEGQLARRFAALVARPACTEVARSLHLGRYLRLSDGEESTGGRDNDSTLADVCEAIIGALYVDGGLGVARHFVQRHWADMVSAHRTPPRDPKTTLQEWAQHRGYDLPTYEIVDRKGPDHAPSFTVEVRVGGDFEATGTGGSKRLAEQSAASALLGALPKKP